MKRKHNSKQLLACLTFGFFMVTGTYNAIVINSESSISGDGIRFSKRLDEIYGTIKPAREVAASIKWQKLSMKQAAILKSKSTYKKFAKRVPVYNSASDNHTAPTEVPAVAAVQDDLNLSLTEVVNPKKWQQGLNNSQFSGNLNTNNGVIESLSVSLPNGEGLSVSFSEMTGNVFEYDFDGELYSGMMYQVDQSSYMVTLTNGPLEGTRLKFTGEASVEQQIQQEDSQRALAENSQSEAGGNVEEQQPQIEQAQVDQSQPQNLEIAAGYQQQPEQLQAEEAPVQQQEIPVQDIYAQEQGQIEQQNPETAQGYNFEVSPQTAIN